MFIHNSQLVVNNSQLFFNKLLISIENCELPIVNEVKLFSLKLRALGVVQQTVFSINYSFATKIIMPEGYTKVLILFSLNNSFTAKTQRRKAINILGVNT